MVERTDLIWPPLNSGSGRQGDTAGGGNPSAHRAEGPLPFSAQPTEGQIANTECPDLDWLGSGRLFALTQALLRVRKSPIG